jgi:hypothetical protein
MSDDGAVSSFAVARAMAAAKFDNSKRARMQRYTRTVNAVSMHTLTGTGRSTQFNFRCRPDLKERVHQIAGEEGVSVAEFMERAMEYYIEKRRAPSGEQPR